MTDKWTLAVKDEECIDNPINEVFHIASRGSDASVQVLIGKEFMVRAGSIIPSDTLASLRGNYDVLREQLILSSVIKDFAFTAEYVFESPSAAAVVLGRVANGPREW